jgi:transposase InsO family protein
VSKATIAKELGVARATLYYQSRLAVKDERLRQDILNLLHLHPSYGYRRIAIALGINKKRAQRVMQLYCIKPYRRHGKKPPYAKRISLADIELPNLIKDHFPNLPGDVWVSDFTHVRYHGRWVYLATVMDLFSREIVGWFVSTKHDTALVAAAFFDALEQHPRPNILHSDRGSEYLSQAYIELASHCGISMSYSAKAHPWENGYQESFYNGFKVDLGDPERFSSIGELIEAIHLQLYIYNHYRIHLALKMSPKQYLLKQQNQLVVI